MTVGSPVNDPPGQGWLQLTEAANSQIGSAIYDKAFSSAEGLQITFDYAAYNGTGADEIAFQLHDAAPGGLRYVSIHLDEYGGTSSASLCWVPCSFKPNSVTARGAQSVGGPLIASVALNTITPGWQVKTLANRASVQTVRITVSPASASARPTVKVEIDPTGTNTEANFVEVIGALDLSSNGAVPDTFKLSFYGRTGASNNIHEIRIRNAKTLKALSIPTLGQSTLGALAALLALLTLPALRSRFKN
ncbi:MAG: hypothetical protein LBP52_02115 [Burkholderiaceae bacterium]|nr:hypothetical protein [Burkholderiaceae bacterium]